MMRSGGRRGNFRGTVESPFLRHRFTDARQDNLLPSLREAAAALCRNADPVSYTHLTLPTKA